MGMTSSTWNSEACGPLRGAGVDAERIARFARPNASPNPLPMVFTEREAAHAAACGDPARALCAAFCVKEALFKAAGRPVDVRACEVFARPGQQRPEVVIGEGLAADLGGAAIEVRLFEDGGNLIAAVVLTGEGA